jgi:hypothetical protein
MLPFLLRYPHEHPHWLLHRLLHQHYHRRGFCLHNPGAVHYSTGISCGNECVLHIMYYSVQDYHTNRRLSTRTTGHTNPTFHDYNNRMTRISHYTALNPQ